MSIILKNEDFEKAKREAENFYSTIDKVYCPCLNEKIIFNAKGLRHLKFKSDRVARKQEDQYARLKLIFLAPQILKKSHTLQGLCQERRFEEQKTNSCWKKVVKEVFYYEFIAVIDSIRVKIIVKEVFGGVKYFWSIIPFWGIDRVRGRRILHNGKPAED